MTDAQRKIMKKLESYGIGLPHDARHVEAWMRVQHGDEVPSEIGIREILHALRAAASHPLDDSEVLAKSYNL